jgi:hypothetical protein
MTVWLSIEAGSRRWTSFARPPDSLTKLQCGVGFRADEVFDGDGNSGPVRVAWNIANKKTDVAIGLRLIATFNAALFMTLLLPFIHYFFVTNAGG